MTTFNNIALILIVLFVIIILFGFKVTISRNTPKGNVTIINKGGLRPSCLMCVRKHIGQAIALLEEVYKGYPDHKWLALGHLAEAEDESLREYPELATKIREARLNIQDGGDVNLVEFYPYIDSISK